MSCLTSCLETDRGSDVAQLQPDGTQQAKLLPLISTG